MILVAKLRDIFFPQFDPCTEALKQSFLPPTTQT